LDTEIAPRFIDLIALAKATFEQVSWVVDSTPQRTILRLQARYRHYRILVTELLSLPERQYRYYVLHEEWVEAGFDNAPDPRAIRLKYGRIGQEHANEPVPHLHKNDKRELILTQEMTFPDFVAWVKENL